MRSCLTKALAGLAIGFGLTVWVCNASYASTYGRSVFVGAGSFSQNLLKITGSSDASKSFFGQLYAPQMSLMGDFRVSSAVEVFPTFAFTPISATGANGVKKSVMLFTLPFGWAWGSSSVVKVGPGLMMYSVSGDGASQTLNNGSSTATFYRPGSSQTAKEIVLDLGAAFELFDNFRLDLDAVIPGLLTTRRSLNISVALNWAIF